MFNKLIQIIFGSKNERDLKQVYPIIAEINSWEEKIRELSDDELKSQTIKFRTALAQGASLNDLLAEAFATVREAAWRTLGMRHFDVQMIGAIVLDQGKIAEMKTGEGKTLTATASLYINALPAKGVHLVTVNDYLASRDAKWMEPVYNKLGMKVGIIQHSMAPGTRKAAYAADITYGTNSEFGFDYLRDNMLTDNDRKVQRGFNFAIVDEVDSILIDEARTPLIISGPTEEDTTIYININRAINQLIIAEKSAPEPEAIVVQPGKEEPHVIRGYHYDIDEKSRNVFLSEKGVEKLEEIFGIENLFALDNTNLVVHSNQSLKAHLIFKAEVDYVLQDGEVVLVDEHTGRTMPGRRYGDGLHQAIEAKEKVSIKQESQTLASVTYQNFFRLYKKLAGMTGTADTEAEEFKKIYKLDVVVVPTNIKITRIDYPDKIYCTEEEKYEAITKDINDCIERGQPTLVGTISIEKSEYLSACLKKAGIKHSVLNARHHEQEASIIANAGKLGVVTVATNMAGRGTDIVLGGSANYLAELDELDELEEDNENITFFKNLMLKKKFDEANELLSTLDSSAQSDNKNTSLSTAKKKLLKDIYLRSQIWVENHNKVKEAGGLHILGTERHEARRIDNQLRGRSGRQGDPGSSRFYLSLEDHLMRIFGGERIRKIMNTLGMDRGQELQAGMVDRAIARAQKRVESHNFDIRKHLLEYDEVMNTQREFIYKERNIFVESKKPRERLLHWLDEVIETKILNFCDDNDTASWDLKSLNEWTRATFSLDLNFDSNSLSNEKNPQLVVFEKIQAEAQKRYQQKSAEIDDDGFSYVERRIALDVVDARWKEHLHQMDQLREGVWASGYAEKNPLVEFKLKGFGFFDDMVDAIKEQVIEYLFRVQIDGPLDMAAKESEREDDLEEYSENNLNGKGIREINETYDSFSGSSLASSASPTSHRKTTSAKSSQFGRQKVSVSGTSRRKTSRRRKRS